MSLNFPGGPGDLQKLRLPLVGLAHSNVAVSTTFADLSEVLAWSFKWLALGQDPSRRHDDGLLDRQREKMVGQRLGVRGCLGEVRGDRKFLEELFGFPGWNTNLGTCWLCKGTLGTLRDVGRHARWRKERRTFGKFLEYSVQSGVPISPLFGAPWLTHTRFRIDWLHCADTGAPVDFVGGAFWHVVKSPSYLPSASRNARGSRALDAHSAAVQHRHGRSSTNTVLTMIRKNGHSKPKPKCSAAVYRKTRSVCGDRALHLLERRRGGRSDRSRSTAFAQLLSEGSIFQSDVLLTSSPRFAAQMVALETVDPSGWCVKPKLHLFLELCSSRARPTLFWNYRDEDFGGSSSARNIKESFGALCYATFACTPTVTCRG